MALIHPPSTLLKSLLAACAIAACTAVHAAPFTISYAGVGARLPNLGTNLSGATSGPGGAAPRAGYRVDLIVDNGGTSANDQEWTAADVRCVVWTMRRNGNTVYSQIVTPASPITTSSGSIQTNASGGLQQVFTTLAQSTSPVPGNYTIVDPPITPPGPGAMPVGYPTWFIPNSVTTSVYPDYAGVFFILVQDPFEAVGFDQESTPGSGTGGGEISTGSNVSNWSAPIPAPTNMQCAGKPLYPSTPGTGGTAAATPVPSLGTGAILALGLGAASLGALRLRRRKA